MKRTKYGKLYGIGVGPGDPKLLTLRAKEILDQVDVIFCPKGDENGSSWARSIIETTTSAAKEFVELPFSMTRDKEVLKTYWEKAAQRIAQEIVKGKQGAFITLGDPFIYSTYIYLLSTLLRNYPDIEVETIPGISAFNAAAARAQVPLVQADETMAILPVRKDLRGLREALKAFDTVVLMKVGSKLDQVVALLKELDLLKHSVLVSHLGQPGEKMIRDLSTLERVQREGYLSVIIVKNPTPHPALSPRGEGKGEGWRTMMKVYFIGAGPGDPELLTLKAKRILETSDVVVYAGSLINPDILKFARQDAVLHDSSTMELEEILKIYRDAKKAGRTVARVHTGDLSIYSALQEQLDACEKEGIDCEIVPGISSYQAAAATLRRELTLPGVSQTLILTRMSGRTEVPERENLAKLAETKATMAIFLSVHEIERVVAQLAKGYGEKTPVAVVEKASWAGERKIIGTLENIAEKVKEAGIKRHALIVVGEVLGKAYQKSKLYDADFEHGFRRKKSS